MAFSSNFYMYRLAMMGETGEPMTRLKEHFKLASPRTAVGEHEHPISQDNVKVIAREDHTLRRKIRESVEIRTRRPAINRDQGYELPRIYDQLLSCDRRSGDHVTSED